MKKRPNITGKKEKVVKKEKTIKKGSAKLDKNENTEKKEVEKKEIEKKEKVVKKKLVQNTEKKESKPKSPSKPKTKNPSKPKTKLTHLISSTMLSEIDRDILFGLISSLGDAKLISHVNRSTTLLVAGQDARSVKMMCAVARGIPVVTPAWLYACMEQGKWVDPDCFISSFAEEGLKKRKEQEKGILANNGPFFIAQNTQPPRKELIEIIQCCDGNITGNVDECEVVIGKIDGREYVKEAFVLDGAMKGELPRISEYIVKDEEESDEFYRCLYNKQ